MTVDTTQLLADVLGAVSEVGANVSITTFADVYSTATGKTTRTPSNYTVLASPLYGNQKQIGTDGRMTATAQLLLPASAVSFTLAAGAKVTAQGRVWTVQQITTHAIAATVLAYELTLTEGAP
jgi:hypothetical protein